MRYACALLTIGPFAVFAFPAGEKGKPVPLVPAETKVFELTNAERKQKELRPYVLSPLLCKLARAHAENMAAQGKLAHTLDGKTPYDRLLAAGYKYLGAGENIGMGDERVPVAFIVETWMGSDGHRANILSTHHTEIGVGIARDKEGQVYYTQIFARPR